MPSGTGKSPVRSGCVGRSGVWCQELGRGGQHPLAVVRRGGAGVAFDGFVGTYAPRMDDKGRVTLPAKYRDKLAGGVMLMRGQDHTLFLLTPDGFESFADRAIKAEITDQKQIGFQRYMFANTEDQRPDAQGRITIPPKMRAYANLEKDVVINGAGLRMEIWAADAWARYEAEQEAAYASPERGIFSND
jgi:MraZ protein